MTMSEVFDVLADEGKLSHAERDEMIAFMHSA
jgi:hypothetical protein